MVKTIAELSINHLGMKKIAMATIKSCQQAGADYIKLKKKNVDKYYKQGKVWRGYNFKRYRQSLELSESDFYEIDEYCKELNIPWFSTVHDKENLEFISQFNPPFYKIASMDARNPEFISWFTDSISRDTPIIVSTGGMTLSDIKEIARKIITKGFYLILNHCVSIYPTPLDQTSIEMISVLQDELNSPNISIGYSGHEKGWIPTLIAVLLGAEYVERHVTLSKNLKIHHIDAGLTTKEFAGMLRDIRKLETVRNSKLSEYSTEELSFLVNRRYK